MILLEIGGQYSLKIAQHDNGARCVASCVVDVGAGVGMHVVAVPEPNLVRRGEACYRVGGGNGVIRQG